MIIPSYTIQRYDPSHENQWNDFVENSKNATFLFNRNFMDYHKDRFHDCSLMIFNDEGKLKALFPANVVAHSIYSHQGLTYGGILLPLNIYTQESLKIFEEILKYYKKYGIKTIFYKPIPHIYHKQFAEEDLYALFKVGATCTITHLGSCLDIKQPYKFSSKNQQIINTTKKKSAIIVEQTQDIKNYEAIYLIIHTKLTQKYKTSPTHTLQEMIELQKKFPNIITLWTLKENQTIQAGAWVFKANNVLHVQYGYVKNNMPYLSYLYFCIIQSLNPNTFTYFDIGISTAHVYGILNENLLFAKESIGTRSYITQEFEITL